MTISFWMDDEHVSAAKAVGALPVQEHIPVCALNVGDTISFPGFRGMAYRVVSRHYRSAPGDANPSWLVQLEPAPHPTDL